MSTAPPVTLKSNHGATKAVLHARQNILRRAGSLWRRPNGGSEINHAGAKRSNGLEREGKGRNAVLRVYVTEKILRKHCAPEIYRCGQHVPSREGTCYATGYSHAHWKACIWANSRETLICEAIAQGDTDFCGVKKPRRYMMQSLYLFDDHQCLHRKVFVALGGSPLLLGVIILAEPVCEELTEQPCPFR